MKKRPPTATDLSDHPQLAVLAVLESALDQSTSALLRAHPEYWEEGVFEGCHDQSEGDAYATALVFQIQALEAILQCYRQSIQRSQRSTTVQGDVYELEIPA